ncbi:MAG: hypothetical protein WC749_12230 [Dehalococcoidia bacterium]
MWSLITILVVAALAIEVLRQDPDGDVTREKRKARLLYTAIYLMGGTAAFWLIIGIVSISSVGLSGMAHIVPATLTGGLIFLAGRKPFAGGIVLILLGIITSAFYFIAMNGGWDSQLQAILIAGVPPLAAGLILLITVSIPPDQQRADEAAN